MDEDLKHNSNSYFTIPLYFVLSLWLIKWVEYRLGYDFAYLGVKPQSVEGLKGIIFSPLIHGDTVHLFNNSIPLFLLSMAIFYFYKNIAWKVIFFSWILGGLLTWIIGRTSYHIGASGLIYSFAAFLFFSGVFRRHPRLMAISLIVAFLYGSMVWGVFPNKVEVSWEGHLSGAIIGLLLALVFRNVGPRKRKYKWEEEEEVELSEEEKYLEELALEAGRREKEMEEEAKNNPDKLNHRPKRY